MAIHQDFEDLLRCLNDAKAKYLIVGAHAVAIYSEPRYTKDLDIWVEPTRENAPKVYEALKRFGAPLKNLHIEDLTKPRMFYQIGVAPVRVDIIMGIKGVDFSQAWPNRKTAHFGKERVHILGIDELVAAKRASARPQDKLDLKKLAKASKSKKSK
jgi:hypothetical protein